MKLDKITDGELSILQVLWERGEARAARLRKNSTRKSRTRKWRPCRSSSSGWKRRAVSSATGASGPTGFALGEPRTVPAQSFAGAGGSAL